MPDQFGDDETLPRYLLGHVSEEERSAVEMRFLAEEDFFQRLIAAEDELRVAYARGQLNPADRERFEQRFLIFEDERLKVDDARAMMAELAALAKRPSTAASSARTPGHGWIATLVERFDPRRESLRAALALASIVLLGVAIWQVVEGARLRAELARLRAQQHAVEQHAAERAQETRSRMTELEQTLEDERRTRQLLERELVQRTAPPPAARPDPRPILTLFLTPGRVRGGGGAASLSVPNVAADIRLTLLVDAARPYKRYQVQIVNSDAARIFDGAATPAGETLVSVTLPATLLVEDDYELALRGVSSTGVLERAGEYFFTILRP